MEVGAIVYPGIDQLDFTGPFEVLSRMDDVSFRVLWKNLDPVTDVRGLRFLPDTRFDEAPELDVLVVPGGYGQDALMRDEVTIGFLRERAARARYVLSVCTGALLCGAAGLLHGKRATTHWASLHLLEHYGATAIDERVVIDGSLVSTAGVTSGIDGALQLAALVQGRAVAHRIALGIEYAPEPPFGPGTPEHATPEVLSAMKEEFSPMLNARLQTAHAYRRARGTASD